MTGTNPSVVAPVPAASVRASSTSASASASGIQNLKRSVQSAFEGINYFMLPFKNFLFSKSFLKYHRAAI